MRKIILILSMLSVIHLVSAASLNGIRIESDNSLIIVFIDGQQVCTPTTSCFVANLSSGHYEIEVYAAGRHESRGHHPKRGRKLYGERLFYNGRSIKEIYVDDDREEAYYDDSYGHPIAMDNDTFSKFLAMYKKGPFESDRVALLNTTLINNNFTTQQCLQLTEYYAFDDDKMKVMQKLYPQIIDKQNFFMLIDTLSFSKSKDKMNAFIKQYHTD